LVGDSVVCVEAICSLIMIRDSVFFQVNLGIYMEDGSKELSILVDRSVGGSSIKDGQIELMLHRYVTSPYNCIIVYCFVHSIHLFFQPLYA
jgi:hypothetical protein